MSASSTGSAGGGDRITLTGLQVRAHHGVFEHERREGQRFVVDLVVGVDVHAASRGDDLSRTVDYGGLAQRVHDATASDPVDLIESLAQRIADGVLDDVLVQWVRVTVHKPEAPIPVTFQDVAVTIERSQRD
ncbi:MAG: dihydroneopterin aldolase [Nocardioidaceae bacterium]|jgi:dihydroneopterin aldolase|nr:dihydroneopterin aldolase [Nocardioidaceae bacterium]